jgi:uncharacterized protein YjdB
VRIGQSAALVATVSSGGAPAAGKSVQFSSSNAAVASVAPASGSTDASGNLTATVTGVAQGSATITASAEGSQATSNVTVPARSAALPLPFVLLLALLAAAVLWLRSRRVGRG